MKKIVLFVSVGIFVSCFFPSCNKSYNCKCINVQGEESTRSIIAKSRVEAQNNCDEYGLTGHCEIE